MNPEKARKLATLVSASPFYARLLGACDSDGVILPALSDADMDHLISAMEKSDLPQDQSPPPIELIPSKPRRGRQK